MEGKFPKIVTKKSQKEGTKFKSRALSKKWMNKYYTKGF
jgi:hypothetical protein